MSSKGPALLALRAAHAGPAPREADRPLGAGAAHPLPVGEEWEIKLRGQSHKYRARCKRRLFLKKDLYEDPVSRRTDTKNVTERSCVGLECRVNSSADVKGCVVSSPEDGDGPRTLRARPAPMEGAAGALFSETWSAAVTKPQLSLAREGSCCPDELVWPRSKVTG